MDALAEYTWLSILPVFPQVGGKPDHVSSQGKEAVFVTHDIYSRSNGTISTNTNCIYIYVTCAIFHFFFDSQEVMLWIMFIHVFCTKLKEKTNPYFGMGKNQKLCHNVPLSIFSLGKGRGTFNSSF